MSRVSIHPAPGSAPQAWSGAPPTDVLDTRRPASAPGANRPVYGTRYPGTLRAGTRHSGTRRLWDRRRPPPKRGPSLLPDSLIARASFTHGFPHYPNPNLPMALQSVVNRCANSPVRIDQLFPLDKGFGGLDSFINQSGFRVLRARIECQIRFHRHVARTLAPTAPMGPTRRAQPSGGSAETTIESMITGVSGTPTRGSFTGTVPIASTTSVPTVTSPNIV